MKSVKGIGDKKIQKAYEKHKKYIAVDALYFKFARFNLSLSKALKLIKKWGSAAADIIDENVYQLIHIDGFSFETIDRIGLGYYKFDKKDGRRIEAYLIQILKNAASGKGDCFLPLEGQEGLIAQAQLGLNISDNLIREKVIDLIYKQKLYKRLYEGNIVIYLPHIYKAEKTVVQIVSSAIHKNKVIKEDKVDMIIVDFHAEATAEKIAMGYFLDGKVTCLYGTHTHVATADETILEKGTAYITDIGMSGPKKSVIGMDVNVSIKRFVTTLPERYKTSTDSKIVCNGIILDINDETCRAENIRRIKI